MLWRVKVAICKLSSVCDLLIERALGRLSTKTVFHGYIVSYTVQLMNCRPIRAMDKLSCTGCDGSSYHVECVMSKSSSTECDE